MYVCMYECHMYVCINYLCMNLSPAPVVGFGLELAVDYLYSEHERAVSP